MPVLMSFKINIGVIFVIVLAVRWKIRLENIELIRHLLFWKRAALNEIFDIMAKFAEYGFNRSHSAAYSVVAYQTAYLKANYPAEYMASVLSHNMTIEKISFFLEECQKMGVQVLGPDVNDSDLDFSVNLLKTFAVFSWKNVKKKKTKTSE